jgi:hypothetical protein
MKSSRTLPDEPNLLITRTNLRDHNKIGVMQKEYEEALRNEHYRLWWQSLTLSEDYAAALKGQRGEPYASVADDFGPLGEDYLLWWFERGRLLFGEQVHHAAVAELDVLRVTERGDRMVAWRDRARPSLYLRIPLTLERRDIIRQINELLDLQLAKRAEEIAAAKHPRRTIYPDQRMRIATIETLLDVWRARKSTDEEWWQTGERLGVRDEFNCNPGDDAATIKRKRRLMTQTMQRYHHMAAKLIQFAAMGDFPRVK